MSPSVYWRRRAVVAGALLVVILIIMYSCSGGEDPKKPTAKPTVTAQPGEGATPVPSLITPNSNEPSSGQPPNQGGDAGAGASNGAGVTGAGATGETCTDGELTVVSAAENTSIRQGFPVRFFIRIKNVSSRTCVRDVGAQMQELYLEQNGAKQWSSDACGDSGGTADVRSFPPGHEREYYQVWEGKGTAQGCTGQQLLKPGLYQLRGRLGNKVSEPMSVTITA
jgi:hypothetical protein